ncbi:hypothetical protein BCR36DRAFT_584737 [Piromyces finnis]|uniref:Uncharacterized protein n=1 Tax=Piromyces finnis TaxID=1754191 RepID=A0A1Y1V5D3_9FUNG|nr:hypothetical protein BCR36DRAFT_584737 [Piromyces finnis]|eukprot:ORX47630.1 hypothetical protein BCR36DRAFT_584737 [Piromyces finnis]
MNNLPSYDQAIKEKIIESEIECKGNVKIIIPGKETYEIPRKNFFKIKDSIFGISFIIENKTELKWSNSNSAVEDLVIKLISNNDTNFQINDFNGTISEMIAIINELKSIGIYYYFINTTLGTNWNELIKINQFKDNILSDEKLCLKTSELWVKAFNEAMKLHIYSGDFEITCNGKIALNGKDISNKIMVNYDEYDINKELLVNFCLYSDLNSYWDKILSGIQGMLFQNKDIYNDDKLIEKESICYKKQNNCCYQSTIHRHIKFNLVPYINYFLTSK